MGAHQQQRARKPAGAQVAVELADVAADLRSHIGIGGSGRGALELVPLAGELRAGGDEQLRQQGAQRGGRFLLVRRLEVRIEEADRQGLDLLDPQRIRDVLELACRERRMDLAGAVHPLRHLVAQLARDQRRLAVEAQVERLRAVAAANLQQVAEAARGQERGAGAAALQQRVDDKRGAVLDEARLARIKPCLADAVEDRLAQVPIGGRALGVGDRSAFDVAGDEVGEGPADVDGDDGGHG